MSNGIYNRVRFEVKVTAAENKVIRRNTDSTRPEISKCESEHYHVHDKEALASHLMTLVIFQCMANTLKHVIIDLYM